MAPLSVGLIAEARLRGTAVKLAAAARSTGVTTVMTKALRVGTSICESSARTNSNPTASSIPVSYTHLTLPTIYSV